MLYSRNLNNNILKSFLKRNPLFNFIESIRQIKNQLPVFKIRYKKHITALQTKAIKKRIESVYYKSMPVVTVKHSVSD